MPDAPVQPQFEAYAGDQPYLFASYSHKDAASVFPELIYLRDQGYRVWYDEGIDPGNEWPEEIAKALEGAAFFIVFISPSAATSRNVRNEITFALDANKPFLAIHITETKLPSGLQLTIGAIQAIMKFRMTDDAYRRKLEKTLPQLLKTAKPITEPEVNANERMPVTGQAANCGGGRDTAPPASPASEAVELEDSTQKTVLEKTSSYLSLAQDLLALSPGIAKSLSKSPLGAWLNRSAVAAPSATAGDESDPATDKSRSATTADAADKIEADK